MIEEYKELGELKELLSVVTNNYKQDLRKVAKSVITEGDINIDILAGHLISLPYDIYIRNLTLLNITDEISRATKKKLIIEDQVSKDLVNRPELKNQAQRDAEQRTLLNLNEKYNVLESIISTLQRHKFLLNSQMSYFDSLLSAVKLRYRQMCNLVLSDKALQESVSYGQKDN